MKKIRQILAVIMILPMLCMAVYAEEINEETEIIEENEKNIEVNASSYIVVDAKTGRMLIGENETKQVFPASTTKLLTALVAYENLELTDKVVVAQEAISSLPEGSATAGLSSGEVMLVEDLLYCLLLTSANDAANALAYHVGDGNPEVFVELMNKKAQSIGALDTNIVTATGLHEENHYTTAKDMALIAKSAYENDVIKEILSVSYRELSATNLQEKRPIYTSNYQILNESDDRYYEYALGGKSGLTSQAKNCLVAFSEKNEIELISVIFGCESKNGANPVFTEMRNLQEYAYSNFEQIEVLSAEVVLGEIAVSMSKSSETVSFAPSENLEILLPINTQISEVNFEIIAEDRVAPIANEEVLGTVKVTYDGEEFGEFELLATQEVKISYYLVVSTWLKNVYQKTIWWLIGLVIIVVLIEIRRRRIIKLRRKKKEALAKKRRRQMMSRERKR